MSDNKASPLQKIAIFAGSLFVLFHFTAIAINSFGAPTPFRIDPPDPEADPLIMPIDAPTFATTMQPVVSPYLNLIRMTHDYRFPNLWPERFVCKFEVLLRDKDGKELPKITCPSENAVANVQLRQGLLAQRLWRNFRIEPQAIQIAAPGSKPLTLPYWKQIDQGNMVLDRIQQSLTLNGQYIRPSDSSITFARSFGEFAAKQADAKSAEVVRIMRKMTWPSTLLADVDLVRNHLGDTARCSFGVANVE